LCAPSSRAIVGGVEGASAQEVMICSLDLINKLLAIEA
jgi:hypothetical protein